MIFFFKRPAQAKAVVAGPACEISDFVEQGTDEMQDRMMESFGSLDVVLNMPEERWLSQASLAARHRVADPSLANGWVGEVPTTTCTPSAEVQPLYSVAHQSGLAAASLK